ncbi:hypothetical protein Tco_0367206 [Tanacetum coccineum]
MTPISERLRLFKHPAAYSDLRVLQIGIRAKVIENQDETREDRRNEEEEEEHLAPADSTIIPADSRFPPEEQSLLTPRLHRHYYCARITVPSPDVHKPFTRQSTLDADERATCGYRDVGLVKLHERENTSTCKALLEEAQDGRISNITAVEIDNSQTGSELTYGGE